MILCKREFKAPSVVPALVFPPKGCLIGLKAGRTTMKTLILSDLHFGHKISCAGKMLDGIRALARNYDRVILNGDTFDCDESAYVQPTLLAEITDVCASRSGPPEFLTGNHDPIISTVQWVYLPKPALLVFHGDCIADCTNPGRPNERRLASALAEVWQKRGKRPDKFLELITVYRQSQAQFLQHNPLNLDVRNSFWYVAKTLYPPHKSIQVLHYLRAMPRRVARLAATFDQPVRHIVVGHSHRSGCWRVDGATVYNTGSFMPLSTPYAVSVDDETVRFKSLASLLRSKRTVLTQLIKANS
jgi:UDP-2,3-diacylglucosamine pyrophosphatase LpxH